MSSPQLSEPDVRSLVRLLAGVSASSGDASEKKALLMDGLTSLVQADGWFWGLIPSRAAHGPPFLASFSYGGLDPVRLSKFMLAVDHPDSRARIGPCLEEAARHGTHLTRSCRQLSHPGDGSTPLWREALIGETLCSVRPLQSGGVSAVNIFRPPGAPDFDAREIRLAHILLTESAWLHESGWAESAGPAPKRPLSPRRQMVLDLLLRGLARKEMATELSISVHTLDGYVKDIFRHFEAHSQSELIARFRSGNGRDTP